MPVKRLTSGSLPSTKPTSLGEKMAEAVCFVFMEPDLPWFCDEFLGLLPKIQSHIYIVSANQEQEKLAFFPWCNHWGVIYHVLHLTFRSLQTLSILHQPQNKESCLKHLFILFFFNCETWKVSVTRASHPSALCVFPFRAAHFAPFTLLFRPSAVRGDERHLQMHSQKRICFFPPFKKQFLLLCIVCTQGLKTLESLNQKRDVAFLNSPRRRERRQHQTQCGASADMHKPAHYVGKKPAPFTSDKLGKRKSPPDNLTESLTREVQAHWSAGS